MSRDLSSLIRDLRNQPRHNQRLACGYGTHVWTLHQPHAGMKSCNECGAVYSLHTDPGPSDLSLDDVALLVAERDRLLRALDEARARIAALEAEVEPLRLLPRRPTGWPGEDIPPPPYPDYRIGGRRG